METLFLRALFLRALLWEAQTSYLERVYRETNLVMYLEGGKEGEKRDRGPAGHQLSSSYSSELFLLRS